MNICGTFESKRGITYYYHIYNNGILEMWKRVTVGKRTGGYKQKDILVKPTKEAKDRMRDWHGIEVWG